MFWGEAGRLELIAAAEREGTLFPRVKGSIVLSLLGIRSTLGQRYWLQELDFLPGGSANVLGWILPGHWASPLGWCFCTTWNVFSSLIYCRLESL